MHYFNSDAGILVSEWIDGDALNTYFNYDTAQIHKIYSGILDNVRKLHAVRANVSDYPGHQDFQTWHDLFQYKLQKSMDLVPSEFLDDHLRNRIWGLFNQCKTYLKDVDPCVIHGDLRCHNVVYDRHDGQVHLIDFESVMVGDPNFDLLRILCDEQLADVTGGRAAAEKNEIYVLYYLEMQLYWFGRTYQNYGLIEQLAINNWRRLLA